MTNQTIHFDFKVKKRITINIEETDANIGTCSALIYFSFFSNKPKCTNGSDILNQNLVLKKKFIPLLFYLQFQNQSKIKENLKYCTIFLKSKTKPLQKFLIF